MSTLGQRELTDLTRFPECVNQADDDTRIPLALNRSVGGEVARM